MTVLLPSRRWRVRRAPELDPDLVTRWLRPLYPDLALPDAARPEVELSRTADRVLMTSSLYAGAHGVRAVHSEFWDNRQCVLERHSGRQWVIAPVAGTTNETLVNGVTLTAPRPLRQGDRIAVGRQAKGIVKMPLTARALT